MKKIKLNHSEVIVNAYNKREERFIKIVNEYIDEYFDYCNGQEQKLVIMDYKREELKGFFSSFFYLGLVSDTIYLLKYYEMSNNNENIIFYYNKYKKEVK